MRKNADSARQSRKYSNNFFRPDLDLEIISSSSSRLPAAQDEYRAAPTVATTARPAAPQRRRRFSFIRLHLSLLFLFRSLEPEFNPNHERKQRQQARRRKQ